MGARSSHNLQALMNHHIRLGSPFTNVVSAESLTRLMQPNPAAFLPFEPKALILENAKSLKFPVG